MRLFLLAVFCLAVSQHDQVEARDLGVCNGLNFKACAEAFYHSDKSFWLEECNAAGINSPNECIAAMIACVSSHEPEDMRKYKNEQSVLQGEFTDEEDIGTVIKLCLAF